MSEIKVKPDWSVRLDQLSKVESLKVYRERSGFTDYTTGELDEEQEISNNKSEGMIFRVKWPTSLEGMKINRQR